MVNIPTEDSPAEVLHPDQVRAAAALSLAEDTTISAILAEIDIWFGETMVGSPVSRDVHAINHVRASLDNLKDRLRKLL